MRIKLVEVRRIFLVLAVGGNLQRLHVPAPNKPLKLRRSLHDTLRNGIRAREECSPASPHFIQRFCAIVKENHGRLKERLPMERKRRAQRNNIAPCVTLIEEDDFVPLVI